MVQIIPYVLVARGPFVLDCAARRQQRGIHRFYRVCLVLIATDRHKTPLCGCSAACGMV